MADPLEQYSLDAVAPAVKYAQENALGPRKFKRDEPSS
jgi:hypothetical protein